ncbi:MAG: nucleotidyltransferase family protein [Ktedonobacterales bacterium]|nr:nucleotidyltransferase family protein [Ktedonobacterales bacterium]
MREDKGTALDEREARAAFVGLIQASAWHSELLRVVRACDPPDWLIGAGVFRNLVWDALHGYAQPTPVPDVDVVFFDPDDLSADRERAVLAHLERLRPDVPWEVTNQAGVHLWYEQWFGRPAAPLTSSADGVGTWPETATCVGVRLLPNDDLTIVAPYGLSDLFGMVLRRNPRRVTVEEYRARLRKKRIAEKWPRVRILDA